MDRLDQALASEPTLTPSPGFAARVMTQVRREAGAPEPLPFPWRRLLLGLLAAVVAVGSGLAVALTGVLPPEPLAALSGLLTLPPELAGRLAHLALVLLVTLLAAALPRWLEE